ncbi:choline/ethanolamine kinase [Nematocida sp. LUAm3]|nr:choline/ethanolamine kinase [Nematocida sp. LUAm3]KAI5174704.1 choline/ethanolamine kinase [Nematocida sp. LUAm2]KAI5177885.1 choline/ethanolamine kinase [Nematocida sp. LUAm1]
MQEKRRKVPRGKGKRAVERTAELLGCSEKELTCEREPLGYTNAVYRVVHKEKKYLYKEYQAAKEKQDNELKWQRFFKFPDVLIDLPEYRIDKYIDHQRMNKKLLMQKKVLGTLARRVALFHSIVPPESMSYTFLALIEKSREKTCKLIKSKRFQDICMRIEKHVQKSFNEAMFPQTLSLCHNDLQMGNILLLPDKSVELIDFEHVSLNYPCADISNFFNEIETNYQKKGCPIESTSFFRQGLDTYFISEYLKEREWEYAEKDFLEEIRRMRPIYHYYWFLWGVTSYIRKPNSEEAHGNLLYAINRIEYLKSYNWITASSMRELIKEIRYTIKE